MITAIVRTPGMSSSRICNRLPWISLDCGVTPVTFSARPTKAFDHPCTDRIADADKDDRDNGGRSLCRLSRQRSKTRDDHVRVAADDFSSKARQTLRSLSGAEVKDQVLALGVAELFKPSFYHVQVQARQQSNISHSEPLPAGLRAGRDGPPRREPCDDLPAPHSISSSLRRIVLRKLGPSHACGMVGRKCPRPAQVERLPASAVGRQTGRTGQCRATTFTSFSGQCTSTMLLGPTFPTKAPPAAARLRTSRPFGS